jgi:hypothetical protein
VFASGIRAAVRQKADEGFNLRPLLQGGTAFSEEENSFTAEAGRRQAELNWTDRGWPTQRLTA